MKTLPEDVQHTRPAASGLRLGMRLRMLLRWLRHPLRRDDFGAEVTWVSKHPRFNELMQEAREHQKSGESYTSEELRRELGLDK